MLGEGWVGKAWDWLQTAKKEELETLNKINSVVMARDPRDLAKIYVEPDLQINNPADLPGDEIPKEQMIFRIPSYRWLDAFLEEPKRKDGRHVAFVLSDAGMGKTSLLAMLRLTALQGQWPGMRFELFRLGPTTFEDIDSIESPMDTVLLLDSLDEDTTAYGRIEERIGEVLRATQQFRQVIITCRTQFFPLENRFQRGGSWIKLSGFSCQTIYLSLFSDKQIDLCLQKQFPRDGRKVQRGRKLLKKMQSLRMRPMLLSYVEDLLERERLGEVEEWTLFTVYRVMVQAWLDREERKPGLRQRAGDLLKACHAMAIDLQRKGEREIRLSELGELLKGKNASEIISSIEDVGGRSLLNLNSDGAYRFAHYSIQEFLVVDHMARYPEEMGQYSSDLQYTDELVAFLVDWSFQAIEWRANLRGADLKAANLFQQDSDEPKFISGAALRGADLKSADLKRASLLATDLRDADLTKANLGYASLVNSSLNRANLSDAVLYSANLHDADLNDVDLSGTDLSRADLSGADLRGANLSGADLRGANLSGAYLTSVDLTGACNLTQDQINSAKGDAMTTIPDNLTYPEHWNI